MIQCCSWCAVPHQYMNQLAWFQASRWRLQTCQMPRVFACSEPQQETHVPGSLIGKLCLGSFIGHFAGSSSNWCPTIISFQHSRIQILDLKTLRLSAHLGGLSGEQHCGRGSTRLSKLGSTKKAHE